MAVQPSRDIFRLLEIMAALRDKEAGCPWDIEQTFATIVPYTIEEAYEVADAVGRGDIEDLRDELGDLLLQVVFHARMAEEQGAFDFGAVVEAITSKLIRRHPHIFGSARDLSPAEVKRIWSEVKQSEKLARQQRRGAQPERWLDAVPSNLPALIRAVKLQARASEVGFDWNDAKLVLDKIAEEVEETRAALESGRTESVQEEIGDLLFAVVNLARHVKVDSETALRGCNGKFARRFGYIEQQLNERGSSLSAASLDEMERLWLEAKRRERPEL